MAFLTQADAESRLEELRERRDQIDRMIADCLAFLELGRRLQTVDLPPAPIVASSPSEKDMISLRRHGRAMIAACVAILRETRRPMHAGEMLERLVVSGFSVPGADPVAALNTRLWKRSGIHGPFRRLGDAIYELVETSDAPSRDRTPEANPQKP